MSPTPDSLSTIKDLVARFDAQREAYVSGRYNEAQLRKEFIDPMWGALGWDMANAKGYAEPYKEVIHEDAIKIATDVYTKAPDYCFRIGGVRKFFVEAKKPSVDIKSDPAPAFQLRRYAWSAKLPLSVLTDFEELAVYDTRIKPLHTQPSSKARTLLVHYTEYVARWDEIASIFSREAILKGSFDKYADSTKLKRGTAEVDEAFLVEIEKWRDELARNIAARNPRLTARDLNFAVQATIDRIVFLRICEDRGIEPYGNLLGLTNGPHTYRRLFEVFETADARYNSGLFHFSPEKGRHSPPDGLSGQLEIDDACLKPILRSLYYPESPYEFSVLPADILGQVYERFLGKVIRLTGGHRAVIEDKPEVKKAGGVYYTPTYVVDYIVRGTVGPLLQGKRPADLSASGKSRKPLRILDPACGSGSFLLGAYQLLLDWYRDWYIQAGPERHSKGRSPVLYQATLGDWRLTATERKRILLTHIFGVDIDPQAVEVTKLSLLLKVLEGESDQTIQSHLRLFHERALPDLSDNIKCGNSLIGTDFFEGQQFSMLGDESTRVNAFDWAQEFPAVIGSGGFSAVIGNPPWGASFGDEELAYLRDNYRRVIDRMVDSYVYFIDKSIRVASSKAPIGLIVPSTLLNQSDATAVRRLLGERGLSTLVNLGKDVFTKKVLNTSTIFVSTPRKAKDEITTGDLSALRDIQRAAGLTRLTGQPWQEWKQTAEGDPHFTFFVGNDSGAQLLRRLRTSHGTLNDFVDGSIQRGVSPDQVNAHVLGQLDARRAGIEKDLLRNSVSGSQVKRYRDWTVDQVILYTTRETNIRAHPKALAHLSGFRATNTCREVVEEKHPWWALHRPRDPEIFERPKIVGLTTSKTIELLWDPDEHIYVTDAMYVFTPIAGVDPMAMMAVMQSQVFLYLYRVSNQGESRVIPQVKASKLGELPFPKLDGARSALLRSLADELFAINRVEPRTPHDVKAHERSVAAVEARIEDAVTDAYRISKRERSAMIGGDDDQELKVM